MSISLTLGELIMPIHPAKKVRCKFQERMDQRLQLYFTVVNIASCNNVLLFSFPFYAWIYHFVLF